MHVDQIELVELSKVSPEGDELFETVFNAPDGVGADVGNGQRFTRVPRADLAAWLSHMPPRATGPNGEACNHCHATLFTMVPGQPLWTSIVTLSAMALWQSSSAATHPTCLAWGRRKVRFQQLTYGSLLPIKCYVHG